MIKKITVQNFKSLASTSVSLKKFNCLIGLNGAGKTTFLQALDFAAHLLMGKIQLWRESRGWVVSDLMSKMLKGSKIDVFITFDTRSGQELVWNASFSRISERCSAESITLGREKIFESDGKRYRIEDRSWADISFIYEGSLLSRLIASELPESIQEFLDFVRRIRSLELLSPHLMRKRARSTDDDIGSGGEKLSAYLYHIKGYAKRRLIELLRNFYPNLVDYKISSLRSGWKKL